LMLGKFFSTLDRGLATVPVRFSRIFIFPLNRAIRWNQEPVRLSGWAAQGHNGSPRA
jgi:hypothetical protein